MHMNLFFDHYFNFLSAKTKINKKLLNLINLDGLETFKRQKYDMTNVRESLWEWYQLESVSTVFVATFPYYRIIEILEFSFLSIDLKMKTRKSWKISIFGSRTFKCIWIYFSVTILTFWVLKLKYTKTFRFNKSRWVRSF